MQTDFVGQLVERGFAVIDYPPFLNSIVQREMEEWQGFCALPQETKSLFTYSGDFGSGYEYKDQRGKTLDLKENFHITAEELNRLLQIAHGYVIDDSFLVWGQLFLTSLEPVIFTFAQELERGLDLPGFAREVKESWWQWFLRLLHYLRGQKAREVIAASHCDKAGLTVYGGETVKGVQYRTYDNKRWVSMPIESGKMVITANMQMQYKTRGKVRALHHQVVSNKDSERDGRDSIVCFIPFRNTPQYDKAKWGRLQDMPLGFNYDMPHKDFAKFFVA